MDRIREVVRGASGDALDPDHHLQPHLTPARTGTVTELPGDVSVLLPAAVAALA